LISRVDADVGEEEILERVAAIDVARVSPIGA
jgi:hypothetical protein